MAEVHKVLLGSNAGTYLPFALARLRELEICLGSDTCWSQWHFIDNFRIHVKQVPPYQYVYIEQTGGVAYEFFTSEHIDDATLASPGHAHDVAHSFVCGSATRATFDAKGKTTAASPRYSSVLTPPEDATWKLLDCESPQTKDTRLITWASWQNQKFFEYAWHPGNDGKSLVTSTLAQSPGWANRMGMYSPYCWARFGNLNAFVTDVGADLTPALYSRSGVVSGAPILEQSWLYWRRAAVQNAGGRSFFILTDNYGRFHVYPVKDYTEPVTAFKTYTPPYPTWVTVPDPADFYPQFAQWLWRFNKDGTKCVSVPYHSDTNFDFSKFVFSGAYLFCAFLPEDTADLNPSAGVTACHEDTPGLVEFGITIDVFGDGDLDFDAEFTLLRSSYFGTDNRFIFDAAYALPDVEKIGVAEDTLLTAELECRVPVGYYTAGPWANDWASEALDSCRQMQASVVLNANDADLVRTEQFRFLASGPIWFQFPTAQGIRDGIPNTGLDVQTVPTLTGTKSATPMGPGLYDPDGVTVAGRPFFGPLTVGTMQGFLYALELSTLSLSYEVDDQAAGTFTLRGVAYGKEFYRLDGSLGFSLPPFAALEATEQVPSARVHQAAFNLIINTSQGDGFIVHPAGHWAYNPGGFRNGDLPVESDLDWISVVSGKNEDGSLIRTRYTHKDLFNRAFAGEAGVPRDYTFYHQPFDGEHLGDFGSFRTAGFWVTFR